MIKCSMSNTDYGLKISNCGGEKGNSLGFDKNSTDVKVDSNSVNKLPLCNFFPR